MTKNTPTPQTPVEIAALEQELLRLKTNQPILKSEHIPSALKDLNQWILWRYEIVTRQDGKQFISKPPKYLNGDKVANAITTDKGTWKTFEQAVYDMDRINKQTSTEDKIDGVGFVFVEAAGIVGIDIDDSVNADGSIKQWAAEILVSMPQTYWEVSPSGTGLKGLIKAVKKTDKCSKKYHDGKIEIFNHARYFTITTNRLPEAPSFIGEYQQELDNLIDKVWSTPTPTPPPNDPKDSTAEDIFDHALICDYANSPIPVEVNPPTVQGSSWDMVKTQKLTDEKLIDIAGNASNGDKFKALWAGDISGYIGKGGSFDHSAADLALMNLLAFYCGRDPNKMISMFMSSKLYRPGDKAADYLDRTAARACLDCRKVFDGSMAVPSSALADDGTAINETSTGEIEVVPECLGNNDQANAERINFYFGDVIKYVSGIGWFLWNGKIWRYDPDQAGLKNLAVNTMKKIHKECDVCRRQTANKTWAHPDGADRGHTILRWEITSLSAAKIEAAISLLKSIPGIWTTANDMDVDPLLFSVHNGTVNLATRELLPHRKTDNITKISPVVYDPAATCPEFDNFISTMFEGNEPLINYVIDMLGYCLCGDITIQQFWVLWGSGANGKDTLLNLIEYLLGEYFHLASIKLLTGDKNEHETILASLQGKRLVVCSEAEPGCKFRTQLIKQLTGGNIISARHMYQDQINFKRTSKLLLLTNNMPLLTDNGASMERRLKLIPTNVIIPQEKQNEKLGVLLQREAAGILNRLVLGCQHALNLSLKVAPQEVVETTKTYRCESDPIYYFLQERTEKDPEGWVKSEFLYGAYKGFCLDTSTKPVEAKLFYENLGKQGYNPVRRHIGKGWKGLTLKFPSDSDSDFGQYTELPQGKLEAPPTPKPVDMFLPDGSSNKQAVESSALADDSTASNELVSLTNDTSTGENEVVDLNADDSYGF